MRNFAPVTQFFIFMQFLRDNVVMIQHLYRNKYIVNLRAKKKNVCINNDSDLKLFDFVNLGLKRFKK